MVCLRGFGEPHYVLVCFLCDLGTGRMMTPDRAVVFAFVVCVLFGWRGDGDTVGAVEHAGLEHSRHFQSSFLLYEHTTAFGFVVISHHAERLRENDEQGVTRDLLVQQYVLQTMAKMGLILPLCLFCRDIEANTMRFWRRDVTGKRKETGVLYFGESKRCGDAWVPHGHGTTGSSELTIFFVICHVQAFCLKLSMYVRLFETCFAIVLAIVVPLMPTYILMYGRPQPDTPNTVPGEYRAHGEIIYDGKFCNGAMHGKGRLLLDSGDIWAGQFWKVTSDDLVVLVSTRRLLASCFSERAFDKKIWFPVALRTRAHGGRCYLVDVVA